ncbi:replicative DNA helicase [Dermatobacter hominis]|uniref:replicative DNA helicase n=1 Tax=Dermatobacter hominis TaxID=2884263 RepID=UPI001D124809|nr:replicative DNA helicase [Dermatobacter hominis]UDY34371.1 replicative DNA helicase [Dermatobacter hominis]
MSDLSQRPDEPVVRARIPPHSIDAEQSLLGAMLLSEHAISAVANIVTEDDFYKPAHRHVFAAIQSLYGAGQGVDPVTVADELDSAGVLEAVGGPATLVTLQARTPAITNAEHYARIVEEKALLRRLISTANEVAELGYQPLDDIEKTVDTAESLMFAVAQRRNADTMQELSPLLDRSLEQLEVLYERGDAITGTPSGYTDLDHMLAGLQPGALIVVGARPAMGKCLAWDTELVDPDTGRLVTMERAHLQGRTGRGVRVLALDDASLRLTTQTPSDHIDDGFKPVVRVTTALGRTLRCTWTHPFRTPEGWRPLAELAVGERVAAPRRLPVFGDRRVPEHELLELADRLLERDDPAAALPAEAYELPQAAMARFLQRVFDRGGWASVADGSAGSRAEVGLASASPRVVRGIQHLLLRFGVVAVVERPSEPRPDPDAPDEPPWQVVVRHRPSLRTYVDHIAVHAGSPSFRLAADAVRREAAVPVLVGVGPRSGDAGDGDPGSFAAALEDEGLERVAASDVWWDRITAIEPDGLDQVYDLTVPGEHNFVAADLFVHNTAFSLGIAAHAAVRENLPVLFFSLEMGHLELTQRLIAAEARVDSGKLRTGRLTDADWTKITKAMGRLGEGTLWIDDNPALTVMEIRAKARRLQDRLGTNLGLIVVDYLQLMSGRSSAESRQVEVAEISRGLKVLARELGCPVMALSQLSRQLELRADKRPMLADLRESGCLTAGTRLLRADTNEEVSLGELVRSGERDVPVWSLGDDWKMVPATLTHAFPSGTKPAFRLQLASGRRVEATANHPFRTVLGWRRLDELAPGSRIAVPRRFGPSERVAPLSVADAPALADQAVATGAVPPGVDGASDAVLAAFLAEVFGRIGFLGLGELRGKPLVRLMATSCARRLVDDLQRLLLRFGVQSRLTDVGTNRPRWRVWIHGADQQRAFLTQVGVAGERGAALDEALEALDLITSNPNVDTIPCEVREVVVEELARVDMSQRDLAAALGESYCGGYLLGTESRPRATSRDRLARIAEAVDSKELSAIAESDVMWDEVVAVEPLGEQPVFDATVLGTHNFVADGVIAHNSIEQDADVVMFLYRDEVYHPDTQDKDMAEVIVAKHRAGRTGVARLVFLDYCTLFANMARTD